MLIAQAIAVLKELEANGSIDTTWVSIQERKVNIFEVRIKDNL